MATRTSVNLARGLQRDIENHASLTALTISRSASAAIEVYWDDLPEPDTTTATIDLEDNGFDDNNDTNRGDGESANPESDHNIPFLNEWTDEPSEWTDEPRVTVSTRGDLPEYAGFSLPRAIAECSGSALAGTPVDGRAPIFEGSLYTVTDLAEAFNSVVSLNKIDEQAATHLLAFMHQFFAGARLPCKKTKEGNFVNTTASYLRKKSNILTFDVCTNSCCVFAGDYKALLRCPKVGCRALRYTACSYRTCKGNFLYCLNSI